MKVFVAGGTGFLGRRLIARLAAEGHAVSCGGRAGNNGTSGHWRADLTDPASLADLLSRLEPDWIVNCAAYGVLHGQQDATQAFAVNVSGAMALVDAAIAAGATRLLHIGTCFEYGDHPGPIVETATLHPTSIYGITKAAGGLIAAERAARFGLAFMAVRPFSLWGEQEESGRLFTTVIRAAVTGQTLPLTPGEQIRDYVHVEDAAEAIATLLAHRLFGNDPIVNIGYGRGQRLRELARELARIAGDETALRFGALPYRADEMMSLVADPARLQRYGIRLPENANLFKTRVARIAETMRRAERLAISA